MRLSSCILLALALVLAPVIAAAPVLAADAPNVVLIISDDQAWTDFGFMGHMAVQTPELDKLASQSLMFTRGYVPSSLCRASLATLATGLFPHQHKITSNDPPLGLPKAEFLRLRQRMIDYIDKVPTVPRLLGKRGYVSMQTGKWWEGNFSRGGFTQGMTHGDPARGGRHGDEGLKIGRQGLKPIFDFVDEATAAKKPFFLWYAPFLPHSPHNPPQRLLDKYKDKTDSIQMAKYWAMCQWFDETCGQLLDYLDDKKISDNTIVVFVVDNGWIQNPKSGGYAPRSKRSQYDGGLRTPIMVRWPGHVKPGRDDRTPVSSVDLAPTILTACGADVPANLPGVNLLDADTLAARKAIFGDVHVHNAIDINNPAKNVLYRWCIQGRWKLILPQKPGEPVELYDVLADPFEKHNLANANAAVVQRMTAMIDAWWRPN